MLGAMKLNLTADEVLTTTRSVRKRLDFDKPVERAVECLERLRTVLRADSDGTNLFVAIAGIVRQVLEPGRG